MGGLFGDERSGGTKECNHDDAAASQCWAGFIGVTHGERMQDVSPEERRLYASVDTGFIGQNVYLFCASEGLGSVFRGSVDTKKLAAIMRLGAGQFVTFAQSVGYPRA